MSDNIYAIVSKGPCFLNWERSFYVLPYKIDGVRKLPSAGEADWDEVFFGDWTYRLFTAEEAIEAIQKENYWFDRYQSELIDDIELSHLPGFADEKPVVFGFDDFLEYINDYADGHSFEWCLAEIILKEKRKGCVRGLSD